MDRTVISESDAAAQRAVLGPGFKGRLPRADSYSDKLIKYIPPDVIAAFVAIEGLIGAAQSPAAQPLSWIAFAVILVATPLYVARVGGVRKPLQLLISTVAFVVWAFAYRGPPFNAWHIDPLWGAVILALFTFLIPLVSA